MFTGHDLGIDTATHPFHLLTQQVLFMGNASAVTSW